MSGVRYPFDRFLVDFEEAIKASGNPNREDVEKVIENLQKNAETVPSRNELWPIHMFVRKRISDADIPLDWLSSTALDLMLPKIDMGFYSNYERLYQLNKFSFTLPEDRQLPLPENHKIAYAVFKSICPKLKKIFPDFQYDDITGLEILYISQSDDALTFKIFSHIRGKVVDTELKIKRQEFTMIEA